MNQNKHAIKSIITLLKGMVDYVIQLCLSDLPKRRKTCGKIS